MEEAAKLTKGLNELLEALIRVRKAGQDGERVEVEELLRRLRPQLGKAEREKDLAKVYAALVLGLQECPNTWQRVQNILRKEGQDGP